MNLIIHHWDTDGICSAAIIASVLEKTGEGWTNVSPVPGVFEFDERIWKMADKAEKVFVVDLNMPESVEKLQNQVFYFDHHLQPEIRRKNIQHINPVLHESHGSYPSATCVVSEYFGMWNHLSALGAAGDLGKGAFDAVYGGAVVGELLREKGLSKDDILKLVSLIDSPSVVGDRNGVEDAVKKVKDTTPSELLKDIEWNDNLRKAELEISRVFDAIEVKNGIAYAEFSSNYNIISKVGRKLVWDLNYDAAFVVNRNYHGYSQLYFRVKREYSEKFGIPGLIKKLRKLGINAGGKKDVVGIICKSESLGNVVEVMENYTGWKNGK